jgi:hypothetical protein
MSYEPNYGPTTDSGKELRDKLARIACRALAELERVDPDNKVLQNKETKAWWTQHKIDDAKAMEAKRKAEEAKAKKKAALAKLTDEDRRILGL